ncbi:MAG: hypothetical protein VR64_22260 [Desulfatitalea sp. BRH_c12]|nr:MAG: hypothetical protein VR64_22260 [Desulfatitalea sp. BRH_c12]
MSKIDFGAMRKKWKSTVVARKSVGAFTGGFVSAGTVANADAVGKGPEDRFRIGRNVGYSVDSLIDWLETRATGEKQKRVPQRTEQSKANPSVRKWITEADNAEERA